MATAQNIIDGSLRMIGVLAEGEAPSSAMASDALTVFNQWLDADSINRQSVFSLQDQSFTWAANDASVTFGPSGADHTGTRPIAVDLSTYFRDSSAGLDFAPINQITAEDYNSIVEKTSTSTYPTVLWVNMTMPNITLTVFPVPSRALVWHLMSVVPLTTLSTLATTVTVPPGYLMYFRYNLAIMMAAEFGVEPPPDVKRIASNTRRSIKRINRLDLTQKIPAVLFPLMKQNIITGV